MVCKRSRVGRRVTKRNPASRAKYYTQKTLYYMRKAHDIELYLPDYYQKMNAAEKALDKSFGSNKTPTQRASLKLKVQRTKKEYLTRLKKAQTYRKLAEKYQKLAKKSNKD